MDAHVGVESDENIENDNVEEKLDSKNNEENTLEAVKKKPKKEKIGFRDRKVCDVYFILYFLFY